MHLSRVPLYDLSQGLGRKWICELLMGECVVFFEATYCVTATKWKCNLIKYTPRAGRRVLDR